MTVLHIVSLNDKRAVLVDMRHQTEFLLLRLPAHFLFLPTFPQDDIQIIINQQLRTQQQSEHPQKKPTNNGVSFFRRPSRTASTWTRQPSTSSTWSSDTNQNKAQSPWRDWLRRGKGANNGQWVLYLLSAEERSEVTCAASCTSRMVKRSHKDTCNSVTNNRAAADKDLLNRHLIVHISLRGWAF